jgi:deoxycytidylate deaminase
LPIEAETVSRPELFVALVGAAGARLNDLSRSLKENLGSFGYHSVDIRLSDLLVNFRGWTSRTATGEFERIKHLQDMGNTFRRQLRKGDALARAGISEIRRRRADISGGPDQPAAAHAYIVHQLKHPEEVDLLHQVYGSSFLLIAGHAPRDIRLADLARQMAREESQPGHEINFYGKALDVITSDEKQEDEYGQNTRDTYPRADCFANLSLPLGEHEVGRFLDLVFGHPFRTPSHEEYAMYQASAASLRSSDDNRQVGAVIVSLTDDEGSRVKNADVIAVGMNEVPRGGGGFYWDKDSPDNRDQALLQRGEDRAREIKISALAELIEKIRQRDWLQATLAERTPSDLANVLVEDINRTQFMEIGEFSRPVHAEMAALIDSARRGVAVQGRTMYVTTFPCHNCAKHIIAAGLRKVVYLEPYPKSRAHNLHGEEIVLESPDGRYVDGKVVFCAFTGIAPRQYRKLFSMSERGARKGRGKPLGEWQAGRRSLSPRYVPRNAALAYLAAERQELEELLPEIYQWDRKTLCPS